MKRHPLLPLICAILFVGCGESLPDDVKPDDAGKHLRSAMESWKSGKPAEELKNQSPSITMNESDWNQTNKLVDYAMEDSGTLSGRQMKWVVRLKLKDPSGKVNDRKATYIIDTIPQIVIVRDSFAS